MTQSENNWKQKDGLARRPTVLHGILGDIYIEKERHRESKKNAGIAKYTSTSTKAIIHETAVFSTFVLQRQKNSYIEI